LYYRPEIGPIQSTENFNCIQYGLSFTTTGSAGRDLNFKTPDQVISELKNYERLDLPILKINGDKVIPLFVHQPDFEDAFINGKINETKWSIYTETLSRLMNDPDVTFISAEQAWELTHPINNGEPICQYAKTASALSENSGSEAIFATGAPDSSSQNECNNWGGSGYSWNPINWNTVANLTLTYDKLVYANNLTIFGDYDMCFRNIWVKNSKTGEIKNIFSGNDNNCNIQKDVDNFLTDTIILETCGWAWSSTDSVQLCGIYNSPEEPPEPPSTKICQYATASSALSENSGSEAIFATGPPNSPSSGVCDSWAGTGYSWNPTNWNIKSNITLTYEDMMNVDNFTVIGDYDMCWDRIWLKNSQTGETLSVFTGPSSECVLTRGVSSNLEADTIILETCGWAWSSTDSVQLCGNVFIS
jgi:hypothetical protein